MTNKELRQRLIELIEQPMPMMCGTTTYGEMRMPEYQARFIVNNLIANGVTIRECGDWVHLGGDEWCCSACEDVIHTEGSWEKPTQKFCEECGADMRGVKDE